MGAKPGQSRKSAGNKRLALVVFSALLVVLFAVFAVAQGIGQPSVPSGDVALVKGLSDGHISEAEFKRTLAQQLAASESKKAPKPGSSQYEEATAKTLGEMLEGLWIGAEAEAAGITVTEKQIETELASIKKQNFPTEKIYQEFLKTSHFTQAEVDGRVELQILVQGLQKQIASETPAVSSSEISNFYEASKATQFTTKPSRDVRLIVNRNQKKAEAAKAALDQDDSAASWKGVAAKYSADPTTKTKGGLQKEITEELLQGPLKKAIYGSATGEVVGPVSYQGNYFVVEVEKLNPEKVKSLPEVKSQIATQLAEQKQQAYSAEFFSAFQSKWRSRSYCASQFTSVDSSGAEAALIQRCANFKGSAHPASAPEACYEADPKAPASECPAPVEQTKPALPGSVDLLKPTGEPLVQRPQPEATKASATESKAAEVLEEAAAGRGE